MLSRFPRRRVLPALSLCLAAILLTSTACGSSQAAEISITTQTPAFTGDIYIGGAVNNPGIYPFSPDDSLDALIAAAGGLQNGADISQVSLIIPDPTTASLPSA
jgi:hypothetical protein